MIERKEASFAWAVHEPLERAFDAQHARGTFR